MKKLILLFLLISNIAYAQFDYKAFCKKTFKFSTFYAAASGGTSISDVDVFSVTNGLETSTIKTPFDYNLAFGIRKIANTIQMVQFFIDDYSEPNIWGQTG